MGDPRGRPLSGKRYTKKPHTEPSPVFPPGHPFYSPQKGWTDACKLRTGDILVLVNGEYVVVEKVQHELLETPVKVYNFQVQDYHTYFVADSGVLVHNKCGDYKKIDPASIEKDNDLPSGTFHREVKSAILQKERPPYTVGRNPDILLNRNGNIAYQGANGFNRYITGLNINDIIKEIMKK